MYQYHFKNESVVWFSVLRFKHTGKLLTRFLNLWKEADFHRGKAQNLTTISVGELSHISCVFWAHNNLSWRKERVNYCASCFLIEKTKKENQFVAQIYKRKKILANFHLGKTLLESSTSPTNKAIPLQSWTSPEGSRKLRLKTFYIWRW